jgi:hypothetical protein
VARPVEEVKWGKHLSVSQLCHVVLTTTTCAHLTVHSVRILEFCFSTRGLLYHHQVWQGYVARRKKKKPVSTSPNLGQIQAKWPTYMHKKIQVCSISISFNHLNAGSSQDQTRCIYLPTRAGRGRVFGFSIRWRCEDLPVMLDTKTQYLVILAPCRIEVLYSTVQ